MDALDLRLVRLIGAVQADDERRLIPARRAGNCGPCGSGGKPIEYARRGSVNSAAVLTPG
jgi:hypothetical protein